MTMISFPDAVFRLFSTHSSDMSLYLLADISAIPASELSRIIGKTPALDILTQATPVWSECASPVLLHLPRFSEHTANIWQTFAARWQYANALILIESTLPHTALCHALHARTEAMLPEAIAVLLRYFDTRTFQVLLTTLEAPQRATFLGIASTWLYADRYGSAVTLPGSAEQADTFIAPLTLTPAQESALIDAGEADTLVNLLLDQGNTTLATLPPYTQHEVIACALDTARTYGIDQLPDQIAYCTLSLALGPGFHDTIDWQPVLSEVRAGRQRFMQALLTVSETTAI